MTSGRVSLVALALATTAAAWLDPHAKAREAARLYAAGKYGDAVQRYNEALTDHPDSALLHFNLGDAAYKSGKYTDAVNAFQQVPDSDRVRAARSSYNVGNAKYRLGEAAAASDPKAALGLWAEALVAYRRAMGLAPDDVDAKFNHELVEKKIAELQKKLEEQQKQKDQQAQDQQQQQPQGQPKPQDQQDQQQQQQAQGQEQQKPNESQEARESGQAEEKQTGSTGQRQAKESAMSPQEAAAVLDSQRDQEVRPDEITKRVQGAVVAEPAQDW
jgi:Ca-activated chloride channel homolog